MACRAAVRTVGWPSRCASRPITVSGVSGGCTMRAVRPSAQVVADTSQLSLPRAAAPSQSPAPSLSSISRSCVGASGTRSSASASDISASPSLVERL